jgi:hypothetical protein
LLQTKTDGHIVSGDDSGDALRLLSLVSWCVGLLPKLWPVVRPVSRASDNNRSTHNTLNHGSCAQTCVCNAISKVIAALLNQSQDTATPSEGLHCGRVVSALLCDSGVEVAACDRLHLRLELLHALAESRA